MQFYLTYHKFSIQEPSLNVRNRNILDRKSTKKYIRREIHLELAAN